MLIHNVHIMWLNAVSLNRWWQKRHYGHLGVYWLLVPMLLLCSASPVATARATPADTTTITWYMYDLPPYHILRGADKGTGPLDFIYQQWQTLLPTYDHQPVAVNTTRMVREFQSDKDHRCITSSFIFPQSKDHWVWSKAIYVEPPAVIVTRRSLVSTFMKQYGVDIDGTPCQDCDSRIVDFRKMIATQSLRFGHFEGRIYSGFVDALINDKIDHEHVISVSTYAPGEGLMRMLQRGRVDYIVEYLPEIHWLSRSNQLEADRELIALKIAEHHALSPVHVGCTNTAWGNGIIEKLNQQITPQFRALVGQAFEPWLLDDFNVTHFREAQSRYFDKSTVVPE